MATLPPDLHFQFRRTNGITLHVAEAGPEQGKPIILLHGFPEFWFGWRQQIAALAGAGYRVIAPDQRGYNKSDKPAGVAAYDLDQLAADVVGLADAYGFAKVAIVGHDWGATVGWWVATRYPDRVDRLAALNAPHPAVWKDAMRNNPAQRRLSWYVGVFRLPWLPEFMLRQRNFRGLSDALRQSVRAGAVSDADLDTYRAAWAESGALTAMTNWYRAILRKDLAAPATYRVTVPTCILWGRRDAYAIPELAEASAALCAGAKVVLLDQATHWVQHDEPEQVNETLLAFLAARV